MSLESRASSLIRSQWLCRYTIAHEDMCMLSFVHYEPSLR